MSDAGSPGHAQLLLRVWIEPHDASLRGRLVTPALPGRSTARGIDDLCELVRLGLQRLQEDLL